MRIERTVMKRICKKLYTGIGERKLPDDAAEGMQRSYSFGGESTDEKGD